MSGRPADADAAALTAACRCFYCFRRLHAPVGERPEAAALLGDYFFSRFSYFLAELDSVPLTDAFAEFLRADIRSPVVKTEDYRAFFRGLPAVLKWK